MKKQILFFCYLFLAFSTFSFGQTAEQKELEKKREQLQQEIARVNNLLFSTQKEGKNLLETLDDLNTKIDVRSKLIQAIENEVSYLKSQISKKEKEVKKLNDELTALKNDYAAMILKSYKSKSEQSKLMFLLSSEDFFQAYKRYRYMQQYADFRKKQGDSIILKTEKVAAIAKKLEGQKSQKEELAQKNKQEADKIKNERENQKDLMQKIKSKEKKYLSEIKKKQKEDRALEKEIERVIREAIAASNKKTKTTTSKKVDVNAKSEGFALTPEGKALATKFEQNRGNLPWPVTEGIVTRAYGVIPHPTLRGIKIDSKGIHITTRKNAIARSVFKGTVLAIQSVSGRHAVYIQHGNYISLYNNLDKVYVSKGQEVVLKQSIGTVFTDKVTGKTILKFQIWKDTQRQNPKYWLAKM
ncbi:murein hydrolase activator EnvC [Wenyingzhuangia sp. 2_MG-2023]|nr:peptidoglycan DD-metalloendopeptidase family protein [Wenyingzhuangia sp. 2_MG-2023]MDO6736554.1 peptidoglycan DD-metalloendopeptidase family protein [Wenyingzhuangia sp. 2_MG-2023]MDO6801151.1 peptidoglycan DD-metalloendopeptidase family protein [Wenyingzhuangia sp. 1_MG-2023]